MKRKLMTLALAAVFGLSLVNCGKLQKIKDREYDSGYTAGWWDGHKKGYSTASALAIEKILIDKTFVDEFKEFTYEQIKAFYANLWEEIYVKQKEVGK